MAATACAICGCTSDRACVTEDGPCFWVTDDLCSACFNAALRERPRGRLGLVAALVALSFMFGLLIGLAVAPPVVS